ncbi:CoA transferase, partial [Variovorax sp. CT11-76]
PPPPPPPPPPHDRARWPALRAEFERLFRTRSRDEWTALFDGSDACVAPVLALSEASAHPHQSAREAFVEVEGVREATPAAEVLARWD